MEAYKTIQYVENSQILLKLPDIFLNKEVEVIVLPFNYEKEEHFDDKNLIMTETLLDGPTWSDSDYEYFLNTTKELREWGTKES
jgi:hypothetical protein